MQVEDGYSVSLICLVDILGYLEVDIGIPNMTWGGLRLNRQEQDVLHGNEFTVQARF